MDPLRGSPLLPIVLCVAAWPVQAEGLTWHGFVQAHYAARVTGHRTGEPPSGDFLLGEERAQLKLSGDASPGKDRFLVKTDFVHDDVAGSSDIDVREAYVHHTSGSLDLKLGRQIVTWGVGDLLFINDVFPKDYTALFSGQPLEYLKKGSDGAEVSLHHSAVSLDVVAIPFFESDRLPGSDRFFLFDPFAQVANRTEVKPRHDWDNTELAGRLYRPILGWDAALYAYRGFSKTPAVRPDSLTSPTRLSLIFPALSVYGASLQGNAAGGVVSLEWGYHDSRDDRSGSDPIVPNSQFKYLAGYQRSPWADFTAGIQYYGELMRQYDSYKASVPASLPLQDRWRQLVTLRLTQWLGYQTWRLSVFTFYSPTDEDYYLIPEIFYRVSDELSAAVGGNIFGGRKTTTFFGRLDTNDTLYLRARYEF